MVDESTANLLAKRIIIDHRLILLGPDIPGGLHTGPLFYYLTALIMFLVRFNPLGEAIFCSLVGVGTTVLLYLIGKKIFTSKRIAVFATIIYVFSCLIIIYNRTYNTLTFSLLAALLSYYSLYQLKQGKVKWIYLLALALILGTHSEGSAFSLVLLSILFFGFNLFPKKINKLRLLGKGLIIWLFSFLPLVFFEFRHNFILFKRLPEFFSFSKTMNLGFYNSINNLISRIILIPQALSRIFFLSGKPDLSSQILPCIAFVQDRKQISVILLFFSVGIIGYFLSEFWKNKQNVGVQILGWHILVMVFGLLLYGLLLPGYLHEWFFAIFFPAFCLIAGYFFDFLWKKTKLLVIVFFIVFISVNLKTFFAIKNPNGLAVKEKAIKYALAKIDSKEFYLDSIGTCYAYGGYRYLFWFYGREPLYSYADNLYWDWLYPRPIKDKPDLGVVMVNSLDKNDQGFLQSYNAYKKITKASQKFDAIEVLIVGTD